MTAVKQVLSRFGAPSDSVVETERTLRYADLPLLAVEAVVEQSHWPLLYVADRDKIDDSALPTLCHRLGMRDESRLLALVSPKELALHDIWSVDRARPIRVIAAGAKDAPLVVPSLSGLPPGEEQQIESVRSRIFKLLTQATEKIAKHLGGTEEATEDALSLAGRALFLRFLADRRIVKEKDLPAISPGATTWPDCFRSPTNAHAVCRWLEETFNGDLLPLSSTSLRFFQRLDAAALGELQKILHRSTADGQLEFSWASLNFAHVPVGVLSEVYEQHAWQHTPMEAGSTSAHYTPRRIAEYMVREAFAALPNPVQAHVLDPAAGGGVFLIASFRQLVEEKYRLTYPRKPTRKEIRSILNNQICGFDVNPSARRLAALGLYLTALELDSKPTPLDDLGFDNLQGRVLFDVRTDKERKQRELVVAGSLGPEVGAEHQGKYDLVIGNPPWTTLSDEDKPESIIEKHKAIEETWRRTLKPIVEKRLGPKDAEAIALPDRTPDIPFLWRSLEWAKQPEDGEPGHIALALPMRIFSKQSKSGRRVQDQLFRAMRITGLLNGSAVRKTEVWPQITHPWCVMFAENRRPNDRDALILVNIPLEQERNSTGDFRADLSQARIITQDAVRKAPDTIKVLTRGTAYDLALLKRLRERAPKTLEEIWPKDYRGQGYQREGDNTPVKFLKDRPHLTRETQTQLTRAACDIDASQLPPFDLKVLHRERNPTIYEQPLVIVPLATSDDESEPRVLFATTTIAYHEQYFGLSAAWYKKNPDLLARWAFLVFGSKLEPYRTLVTSGQVGTEREKKQALDIKRMPFLLPDDFSSGMVHRILEQSTRLLKKSTADGWAKADELVFEAYGLTASDVTVMRDTLGTQATHAAIANKAQDSASTRFPNFVSELQRILTAPFKSLGREVEARVVSAEPASEWAVVRVSTSKGLTIAPPLAQIFAEGESLANSVIFHPDRRTPTLWIAIRNQTRYATATQARLLARTIIHQHEDTLLGPEAP